MRRGVIPHPYDIAQSNVDELGEMDFVFLCIDPRPAKRLVVETLERCGVPFIDVGMGVELVEGPLRGTLRVTTSTPDRRDHFRVRAPLADAGLGDEYNANIQVADLNALNATLAVSSDTRKRGEGAGVPNRPPASSNQLGDLPLYEPGSFGTQVSAPLFTALTAYGDSAAQSALISGDKP